ncbi:hypothetical protein PHLCEN_2v702 [Hermanssonia centrifuga]|uniref:Uncharacterized protein n=1 Tax=Hermanssonia centrifuga TaxID=98765 RepID=A0A2R6S5G3_9APHY|nr:hypothetical protein PHLCEN_2v702 [Hermanssonia centrifuga]
MLSNLVVNREYDRATYDASGETASHQGKPDEQEQPSPPHGPGITKPLISAHSVFVNHIHDDHSE